MNWYFKVIGENYINFNGRARRKEFWYFTLFNSLIMAGLLILGSYIDTMWPIGLYFLAVALPSLAVACRRLHDIGKSGTNYFVRFIPMIGPVWLLIMYCTAGNSGQNQYGRDPKNPYDEFNDIGKAEVY